MIDRAWATGLLSQQIWCWGQDVKRPEGNWLLEIGFDRTTPPEHRKECSSVYTLAFNDRTRITLRGFGIYIGDDLRGGMFIERYGFTPKYSSKSRLECPPWSTNDLPDFQFPDAPQRDPTAMLLLDLLDWIRQYELEVVKRLGIDYRRNTLIQWNNGKRPFIPAEQIASSWRELTIAIAANPDAWISLNADQPISSGNRAEEGSEQ
ncbi:hypothetical protein [Rosistilla oblonga]|uniref:hypothetical protein n=1 Tax=Rosistilla oblonga TaxID=2527990 RepID=UPI003A96E1E9